MNLCKPYRSTVQAVFIIAFTAMFAFLSVILCRFYWNITWVFYVLAGVSVAIGFGLLYRYSVMEYEYCLEGDILSVRRFNGFTWRRVFSLQLTADAMLTTAKKECKREKAKGVSHRQNLSAACAYIIYEQAGKKRYMEFEPNRVFYKIVRDRLGKIKEKSEK